MIKTMSAYLLSLARLLPQSHSFMLQRRKPKMFEYNARQLAYAVLFQAVKDYVYSNCNRAKILKELRCMGAMGKMVANRLEFHLDEIAENMGKEIFELDA
jgi:hypothetical protein